MVSQDSLTNIAYDLESPKHRAANAKAPCFMIFNLLHWNSLTTTKKSPLKQLNRLFL